MLASSPGKERVGPDLSFSGVDFPQSSPGRVERRLQLDFLATVCVCVAWEIDSQHAAEMP